MLRVRLEHCQPFIPGPNRGTVVEIIFKRCWPVPEDASSGHSVRACDGAHASLAVPRPCEEMEASAGPSLTTLVARSWLYGGCRWIGNCRTVGVLGAVTSTWGGAIGSHGHLSSPFPERSGTSTVRQLPI